MPATAKKMAPTLLNRTDYGEAAIWSHSSSVSPLYPVGEGISAGPYIMMPENGGIGVFAHEYAHNLGAMDLYAYGNGETSTGFWALAGRRLDRLPHRLSSRLRPIRCTWTGGAGSSPR